ncbi:MAG: tyrosine--tRNA ligase [Candidatus Neomarinimicrobiota bacterium]|jgi:tyrosyl-tRNA synthetase|nr:tyrosine--tRNA ligase [Candidatus Neomarinimicrobiota bacterium]|tara:strand:- start:138 stop:1346 length:1209 start_codon:yes stop_codon:yes gene_type:complete
MKFISVDKQLELINRGAEEIIPEDELRNKLERSIKTKKPLIAKLGCDPSRPDLHIGHSVVLRKLRHFQDLGHQAVLVIGDFTAMIGDPSGRNKTRPQLSLEEARDNAKTYLDQAKVILNMNKIKVKYNSEWLDNMRFSEVIKLASSTTVARMLERDDFTKRYGSEVPISLHEFLYPLAQAQDSVELVSDIELGGTDQKFNLLMGRNLQREIGQEPQCILTMPILEGTDGIEKMSKSYGNDIGISDTANDMYGKTLSIPDEIILSWFTLAADAADAVLEEVKNRLNDTSINPMGTKRELARKIVELYYDKEKAIEAENYFNNITVSKGIPEDIQEYHIEKEDLLVNVILDSGLLSSKSEARRMIKQSAVRIDGEVVEDIQLTLSPGEDRILKVGKRRFLKVTG